MVEDKGPTKSFLSRWSQRKHAAQSIESKAINANDSRQGDPKTLSATIATDPEPKESKSLMHEDFEPKVPQNPQQETSLPNTDSLNFNSDYTGFMQANVSPTLRNQAMKKLFSDSHFNVMDGLDTYIDDYNRFEPLTPTMLGMMRNMLDWKTAGDESKTPQSELGLPGVPNAVIEPLKVESETLVATTTSAELKQPKEAT